MISRPRFALAGAYLAACASACAPVADIGSKLLFFAGHETADFSEWTGDGRGSVDAWPAPSTIQVSQDYARRGGWSAKLTIVAEGEQVNATLRRDQVFPAETYYSAWYYLPELKSSPSLWVLFKLRYRQDANDPNTSAELFDVDVENLGSGDMTFKIYDHVGAAFAPLTSPELVIPVGEWFHMEAFVRSAEDASGEVVFWLNGQELGRIGNRPIAPGGWLAFTLCNVANTLTPPTSVVYIDDAAISLSRLGPSARLP